MKRMYALCALFLLLCGCKDEHRELEYAMDLRQRILAASECRFEAEITADYVDKLYTFSTDCTVNHLGRLNFRIITPETISGISGIIDQDEGKLTFEETAVSFPLMADGQLSPVSAPWIVMQTLRGGYIRAAGKEDNMVRLTIDDSYQEDALQLDIWLNDEKIPILADILHNGSRILQIKLRNFQIL